jgi:hypothetical protein
MCHTEETKIGGIICSCLCIDLTPDERSLLETYFGAFKNLLGSDLQDPICLKGREVFVICEFFARKGADLWQWGSRRQRPGRQEECILSEDCLDRYGEPEYNDFLKTWLRVYLHEFFEPRESLPEMKEGFWMYWCDIRVLLDFFLHHGGCLTNKFINNEQCVCVSCAFSLCDIK